MCCVRLTKGNLKWQNMQYFITIVLQNKLYIFQTHNLWCIRDFSNVFVLFSAFLSLWTNFEKYVRDS